MKEAMNQNDADAEAMRMAKAACLHATSEGARTVIVFVGLPDGKTFGRYAAGLPLEIVGLLEVGYTLQRERSLAVKTTARDDPAP